MARTPKKKAASLDKTKRKYLKQSDVPSCSLPDALRVPKAIVDNYGSKPATPLRVAKALNLEPSASPFRMAAGASIAYGLTDGGYNAEQISLTDLGKRILKPKVEGDELNAKREAFLRPRVIKEFLEHYDGSPVPRKDIAENVLEEMGVPTEKLAAVLEFIVDGSRQLGLVEEIKNKVYVSLDGAGEPLESEDPEDAAEDAGTDTSDPDEVEDEEGDENSDRTTEDDSSSKTTAGSSAAARRVFITHGKNKAFIEPIKKLLGFGELEPVVSVEKQSVSVPVPDKVMNDMRGCGAAIIHVEDELTLMDSSANEHVMLNPNVLIEIGAAMALFGRRFILIVKNGVKLPSNLQGLYEVRYNGDSLDGDATIRLLEAINDIKNHPMPDRYHSTNNG